MLETIYTSRFKKDFKRMKKRGKNMHKLEKLITRLLNQEALAAHYHDHNLIGNYIFHRECHIEPDWLLIYRLQTDTLRLERTGTHADLF